MYNFFFFTTKGNLFVKPGENVFVLDSWHLLCTKYGDMLSKADKIIISGSWISWKFSLWLTISGLVKKTYFHFWGGDFYHFRDKQPGLKSVVARHIIFYCFKYAAALIFLIEGEYEKFRSITHVSNRYFVAPMPGDPAKAIDYKKYRANEWKTINDEKLKRPLRVLVGNSATDTNHHIDAFNALKRFNEEDCEIFCPLSYGNEIYRDAVIKAGQECFGKSFHPVTEYMERDDYLEFLSTMDIGIFFNDRQQAMGNISMLLNMGKKVYMREETSMWYEYNSRGYHLYKISDLKDINYNDFNFFPESDWIANTSIYNVEKIAAKNRGSWEMVLNDNFAEGEPVSKVKVQKIGGPIESVDTNNLTLDAVPENVQNRLLGRSGGGVV